MVKNKNDSLTPGPELDEISSVIAFKKKFPMGKEYMIEMEIKKKLYTSESKKEWIPPKIYFYSTKEPLYVYTFKEIIKKESVAEDNQNEGLKLAIKFTPLLFETEKGEKENITFRHILDIISQPQNKEYLSPKVIEKIKELLKPYRIQNEFHKFFPALHGKATDSIATMIGSTIEENRLNNTGVVESGEVKLIIEKFNKLNGTLGVSTHKLLSVAIAKFTNLNHTGTKTRQAKFTAINIPLKEYALHCGYDVVENEASTEEEAKEEVLKAKRNLDNARRKIKKDLAILYSSTLSWTEKVRGKNEDYMDIRLVEAKGIRKGFIQVHFSQTFSEYLIKLPITQYPVALLAVDERNSNAYAMGLKFTEHFNMDNNQIKGTAQILRVKTLLGLTSLPTIGKIRSEGRLWEDRIKEPFENSLDALTSCGLLEDWKYCHSKGAVMTDEEATSWESYEEWADTLLHFTLKDAPDHTVRLEDRAEKKKQAKPKKTGKIR